MIPAETPFDAAPTMPSGGILEGREDRRRLLAHELRIWLALQRLQLSKSGPGVPDKTTEFQKMATTTRSWTLGELAGLLGGELDGPTEHRIHRPVQAGSSDPEGITFAESAEYLARVIDTTVGAVLAPRGAPSIGIPTIQVDRPRQAFGKLLVLFDRELPIAPGVHPTAVVSDEAQISDTASIGAYAVVERGARIGSDTRVFAFAYIGDECVVGEGVTIYPHAVLYQDVVVGDRSIIHAGAVLGADGFGFVWDGPAQSKRVKVPQVGRVEIGPDVEIGALTTIDRATAGSTVIHEGAKLDNLVQIGHNCEIGEHTVIASQTAVGGSSKLGRRNEVGGQVAVSDHVSIGDDVMLAGRTGVTKDIPEPGIYWGLPAKPIVAAKRISALVSRLPEIYRYIKELERRIAALEKNDS